MYHTRFLGNKWGWSGAGTPDDIAWQPGTSGGFPISDYEIGGKEIVAFDSANQTADDPASYPPECVVDSVSTVADGFTVYNCTYLGQDWKDWEDYLLDEGYQCNCTEDGCSEYSLSCCTDSNCPTCNCTEDGCSEDSPLCCEDGSCQWLTGSSSSSTKVKVNSKTFNMYRT
jgi:hypothetical protein